MAKIKLIVILSLIFISGGAWAGGSWCHIGFYDAINHPNFNIDVSYQIYFNGAGTKAKTVYLNVFPNFQKRAPFFARIVNHYYYKQDIASNFVQLVYDEANNKYYTKDPLPEIDLGQGDNGADVRVWQTLEVRYESLTGPLEEHTINLSVGAQNNRCYVTP